MGISNPIHPDVANSHMQVYLQQLNNQLGKDAVNGRDFIFGGDRDEANQARFRMSGAKDYNLWSQDPNSGYEENSNWSQFLEAI